MGLGRHRENMRINFKPVAIFVKLCHHIRHLWYGRCSSFSHLNINLSYKMFPGYTSQMTMMNCQGCCCRLVVSSKVDFKLSSKAWYGIHLRTILQEVLIFTLCMTYDSLVQHCSNSIANILELLQSCTKPSISSKMTLSNSSPDQPSRINELTIPPSVLVPLTLLGHQQSHQRNTLFFKLSLAIAHFLMHSH